MKILEVNIYSPKAELLRSVKLNENGLSIIYGEVEKPENNNETTNSIGKTVLLKIINVILGAKNSGKDTIKGLEGYTIISIVKKDSKIYNVKLTLGSSKDYYIDDNQMNLIAYKKFFNIERNNYSKQIMLEKRKGLLSSIIKNASKDDYITILNLLYLGDIEEVFEEIKKYQDEIELIGKYNKVFKEDTNELQKEEFNLEMKQKQIDEELAILNNKIESLKISENIKEIAQDRLVIDQQLKSLVEESQLNSIKIDKYSQILEDSKEKEISADEVEKIYKMASIQIPEMVKKKLKEVENFYKYLIEDKKEIYKSQIQVLKERNLKLKNEIDELKFKFDKLSEVISENDSYKEAIKVYDIKTKEKIEIDSKISEINGKLAQISNTKNLRNNIDILYSNLYKEVEKSQLRINMYKEFVYEIVNKIYVEETRNPYLSLDISNGSYKYRAMPIKIDLSIDGDEGEGISAVKFLLFDLMIMNFNEEIDFLIEDSACFEGIDRRQVKNLILEFKKISEEKNKQLIISLNKYLISDIDDLKESIVLKLSENDTLLNIKF